jgi:hypothetical protein
MGRPRASTPCPLSTWLSGFPTLAEAACALGWTRGALGHYIAGRRSWPADWQARCLDAGIALGTIGELAEWMTPKRGPGRPRHSDHGSGSR